MLWRRIDPVQSVGALFASGQDAVSLAESQLATKSMLFQQMRTVRGQDWIVYFAAKLPSEEGEAESILPSMNGMQPLYEEVPGWWLPVGTELAVREDLRAELRLALCTARQVKPPFVIVPRFDVGVRVANAADLYELA